MTKANRLMDKQSAQLVDCLQIDMVKESPCAIVVHPVGYKTIREKGDFIEASHSTIMKHGKYGTIEQASIYVSTLAPKDKMYVIDRD